MAQSLADQTEEPIGAWEWGFPGGDGVATA